MRSALSLGTFLGIEVKIHFTFLILLGFILFGNLATGAGLVEAAYGLAFVTALFGCVILHEFGHALAARRYGIDTRDITLYPIGGVARLERMPSRPSHELVVALAGPAVNIVLAAGLYGLIRMWTPDAPLGTFTPSGGTFLAALFSVNVMLVAFNLLPAFPMDGGRVFRAILAMFMDHGRATDIAGRVGQGMAVLFGVAGLFANPFLIAIAVFVWIAAAQEMAHERSRAFLRGFPVHRAMSVDFTPLNPNDSVSFAAERLFRGWHQSLPVVSEEGTVGVVTRDDLAEALSHEPWATPVHRVMHREVRTADPLEPLDAVLERLQKNPGGMLPVERFGQIVGVLTPETLQRFITYQRILGQEGQDNLGADGRPLARHPQG